MSTPSINTLGVLISKKRGSLGIRATAAKIGISPATLSRVENGQLPDLENFRKICSWLKINPATILDMGTTDDDPPVAAVHFRKERTMEMETAQALAEMILAAQRAMMARNKMT